MRAAREVFFVAGVRTPFGKAGPKGQYWRTRADDMGVKAVRELLRRNPEIPPERIGDVVLAATAQVGDQGLTLGRDLRVPAQELADGLDAHVVGARAPVLALRTGLAERCSYTVDEEDFAGFAHRDSRYCRRGVVGAGRHGD